MLVQQFEKEITATTNYLKSDEALKRLEADAYWPKWNAPWWHMLLLHEMGLAHLIPEKTLSAYMTSLNRIPLKIFPINPEDIPAGIDPARGAPCHCQLGNVYKVLAACGVAVDSEAPWIKTWFLTYQMPDGGLNCDEAAYRVAGECPSSMVGTIAVFESMLSKPRASWTADEERVITKLAAFLMKRQLVKGSETVFNAEEQKSATFWGELCFPRYYLYDVLRGLSCLLHWAEVTSSIIPAEAASTAVTGLAKTFSDDNVRIGRRIFEDTFSRVQGSDGVWGKGKADSFPLLEKVSVVGAESPFLKAQWLTAKERIMRQPHLAPLLG